MEKIDQYEWAMSLASELADKAYRSGDVPVGSVILDPSLKVVAKSFNNKEKSFRPTGHAEIIAIEEAALNLKNWRLEGCTLIVTLEPCLMCLGAMINARIERLVFGAYDSKGGAISLGYPFFKDKRLNHRFDVVGGVGHYGAAKNLSTFFKERRDSYKS